MPSFTPLPKFIFLLSDHTTRPLACDVAKILSTNYSDVRIEDFLYPIHEGLQMLHAEEDWAVDYGDPRTISPDVQDQVNSLEAWYISQFGELYFGRRAYVEAMECLVD